jgi:IclR family transcriptional regulator, KDG regulon repressor
MNDPSYLPTEWKTPAMAVSKKPPKSAAKTEPATRNRLSSVATAIRLLQAFSEDEAEIGVSALAKKLQVSKSTVHRLAVTLVSAHLLEQNPETERYRLGIGLFGLGTLVRRRMNLSNEARPYLFELRKQTNETILLGIPTDLNVMHVYDLESPQALAIKSDLGALRPAHCTAIGKAIFAFAPEETIEKLLAGPLVGRTPQTVTDPAQLRQILVEVRQRGFAIEDEENQPGVRVIAAPVRDSTGAVIGAVGVAGPSQRLSLDAIENFAPPLIQAVAAISVRLGYGARYS